VDNYLHANDLSNLRNSQVDVRGDIYIICREHSTNAKGSLMGFNNNRNFLLTFMTQLSDYT